MPEAAPARIVREHRRDLREPEHENEIEEELERPDRVPALAHDRTLTRRVGPCDTIREARPAWEP